MATSRKAKKKVAHKPAAKKPATKSKSKPPPPKAAGKHGAPPPKAAKGGKAAAKLAAADAQALYDVAADLLTSFATSNRITRFLLENLDDSVWHAAPPQGRGRTVAAIVSHLHNVRVQWLEAAGGKPRPPAKLDRLAATKEDALKALDLSHAAIAKMIAPLLKGDGRVAHFKAGAAAFLSYLMTHDAHHRGQICLQAKQIGHPLPTAIGYGMWEWSKR
jgi:uncharacterized damage-inducible protein DinB